MLVLRPAIQPRGAELKNNPADICSNIYNIHYLINFVKYIINIIYFFIDYFVKITIFIYMSIAQKIRILLVKKNNISEAELASRLKTSNSNFNQKMKRDNFSERELREIAEVLGCDVKISFVDRQTGEET